MKKQLGAYEPSEIEGRWYTIWNERGAFTPDASSDRPAYTIVIPPPNVTGSLHMGHALTGTIQDILTRHKRMAGYETLWLPGTDHAGIATQTMVERMLHREGTDRKTLGREKFLERVWDWKQRHGGRIRLQQQRLGSGVDWTRERFTLDEGLSRAVVEVFVRLWEEGLIYRDERLVNWDPGTQTAVSDLEVDQEEEDGFFWHLAYPVADSNETLVVATTRPETMLGDTAVAIHPDDPRYAHLHGREVELPLTGRRIPIVCDPIAARMDLGSGAVKITPAHDYNDFETGRRNGLPSVCVLGRDAKINDNAPEAYRGLDRFEARRRIVADLDALGLLVKVEPHRLSPGRSQRSGQIIEPLSVGKQWFVRMEPLAAPAIDAVRDGRIRIVPETWEKTYFHWMENIRDWCISRQLWWGHRVPAWHCGDCGQPTVARETPSACAHCGSGAIEQDEDTLDTWFSSALWPFSTLGWPDETDDLRKFYPTDVLETGFDILFFWVARMIMMGLHFTGEVPFHTVYLHAMVRDRNGDKMSKTKGNVIDPLHLIDGMQPANIPEEDRSAYAMLLESFPDGLQAQGADALRFTLATYAAAGRDIKLDVHRVEGYRAFMNKLWNATKFALMHLDAWTPTALDPASPHLSPADRWILTRLAETIDDVDSALAEYRFADAAQRLYEFSWHRMCDWYLELVKPVLYDDDPAAAERRETTRAVLAHVLDQVLRLLHPFIPFITEELWQTMPRPSTDEELLCLAAWPTSDAIPRDAEAAKNVERMIEVVGALRRLRVESNVPASRSLPLVLVFSDDPGARSGLDPLAHAIGVLARAERVEICGPDRARPDRVASAATSGMEIVVPLEGLVDVEAERARLTKDLARAEKDLEHVRRKLSNERFLASAKPEVIAKDRAKLADFEATYAALRAALERLVQGPGDG